MSIENPTLAHFRHFSSLLTNEYPARTKKPFYAKQTQFAECPNTRKLCINNGLCQYTPTQPLQKQSQTNPIQSQFKANQTQFQPPCAENKANSNPIFRSFYLTHAAYSNPIKPNFKPSARSVSSFCFSLFFVPAIIWPCRNGQYKSFLTGLPNTLPKNASTHPAYPQNSCSAAFWRCSVSIYIRNSTNPLPSSSLRNCTGWLSGPPKTNLLPIFSAKPNSILCSLTSLLTAWFPARKQNCSQNVPSNFCEHAPANNSSAIYVPAAAASPSQLR